MSGLTASPVRVVGVSFVERGEGGRGGVGPGRERSEKRRINRGRWIDDGDSGSEKLLTVHGLEKS
jgi:hypothetical protein